MKRGSFIINGQDSSTYGLFFQERPDIRLARRKIEAQAIYGHDGVVLFDDPSYEEVEYEWSWLMAHTPGRSLESNRLQIHEWFNNQLYAKIIPYFDPTKIWEVRLIDEVSFFNWHFMGEHQVVKLKVSVKPYKKLVANDPISFTTSRSIENKTKYSALPIIKLTGSGDVTLTVNSKNFVIKNITDHIFIDCELEHAYRQNGTVLMNENAKVDISVFPKLNPGFNSITTSKSMSVEIVPNWRSLL